MLQSPASLGPSEPEAPAAPSTERLEAAEPLEVGPSAPPEAVEEEGRDHASTWALISSAAEYMNRVGCLFGGRLQAARATTVLPCRSMAMCES